MDRLIISETAILPLMQWADKNRNYMRLSREFSNKLELVLASNKCSISAKVIRSADGLIFEIKADSRFVAKVQVKRDAARAQGYAYEIASRSQMKCKAAEKGLELFVNTVVSAYLLGNCYLLYGNLNKDASLYIESRNENQDKIIHIRSAQRHVEKHENQRCGEGTHEAYKVRGHYRKYKNGKIVWVSEHQRGG